MEQQQIVSSVSTDKKQKQGKIYENLEDFIVKQKEWIDIEHTEEKNSHEKILQENSPNDLQELGMAIVKLKCKNIKQGLYGRTLVTLTHPSYNEKAHTSDTFANMVKLPEVKISNGDNVGIYRAQELQSNNAKSIVSGIIYKKNQYKLVVSLDDKNQDDLLENDLINNREVYSLILEVNEITYQRYQQTLNTLQKISEDVAHPARHLTSVLFGSLDLDVVNQNIKRGHIFDYQNKEKLQDYFKWRKKDLNEEQKDAIQFCLSRETVGLVHGPPGTGKTMTICELIYQAAKKGLKILTCSGSNIAVDNIVERLAMTDLDIVRIGHPARLLPTIREKSLDARVSKTDSYKLLKTLKQDLDKVLKKLAKCSNRDKEQKKELRNQRNDIKREIKGQERLAVKEVVTDAQVVACTNTGAADRVFQYDLKNTIFDLVVIDEAAQALELSCWLAIVKGKRIILAGDHKQLPPTVKSRNENLSITLFDRILKDFEGHTATRMLKVQYRMNQQIMNWSSQAVYNGELKAAESVKNHSLSDLREEIQRDENCVLMFIDTAGAKMGENISGINDKTRSKSNQGESDLAKIIASELKQQGLKESEIGIITPYNAQVELIKKRCESNLNIEISTVDGFQGREKECIIISMVRSNPMKQVGFLSDYRRMNVAVTRARRFVCLIGDSDTVKENKFLSEMVEYFENFGEIRSAFEFEGLTEENISFNTGFIQMPQQQQSQIEKQQQQKDNNNKNKKKKNKNKKTNDNNINEEEEKKQEKVLDAADIKVVEGEQEKLKKEQDEKLRLQFEEELKVFNEDPKQNELVYDKLNGFERMLLHDLADQMKLQHVSKGNGKLKKLVISKQNNSNNPQQQQEQQKGQQQQQKLQEQQQKNKAKLEGNKESKVKNKQKKQKDQKKDEEEDEMAFLDSLIQANKFCAKQGCKSNVEMLGSNCKFCQTRFCMKHSLAEQHGCNRAAKVDAKKAFKEKQYGALRGEKYVTQQDKEFLRKQLLATIEKREDERKQKPKEEQKEKK